MDLYNIIINDPVFLTIAVILSAFIVFTAIKKMFKYLVVVIALCICYIGYLAYTGEEIPQTTDELINDIDVDNLESIIKNILLDESISYQAISKLVTRVTSAALTSLGTGLWPSEHSITGWWNFIPIFIRKIYIKFIFWFNWPNNLVPSRSA